MRTLRRRFPGAECRLSVTFSREAILFRPIGRASENSELLGFLRATVPPCHRATVPPCLRVSVVNFESFERGWPAWERGDHHGTNAPLPIRAPALPSVLKPLNRTDGQAKLRMNRPSRDPDLAGTARSLNFAKKQSSPENQINCHPRHSQCGNPSQSLHLASLVRPGAIVTRGPTLLRSPQSG